MSEPNEDITNQPREGPRNTDITRNDDACMKQLARLDTKRSQGKWVTVLLGVACVLVLVSGLGVVGLAKVREAQNRSSSQCRLRQIGTALNNLASNTTTGSIPPANGEWPVGGGISGSFFLHLWPYIESVLLMPKTPPDEPIRGYIAPADRRNPRTNSTISYCTNGTVLGVPDPRLPGSFGGRTSSIVVVMERSGLDGAHKWTNTNNVLGTPGNPPPFPQMGVAPAAYLEGSPQGFTSAGCIIGMGDGSARTITKSQQNAWSWACDPADSRSQPQEW